jgi:hypothetical protein
MYCWMRLRTDPIGVPIVVSDRVRTGGGSAAGNGTILLPSLCAADDSPLKATAPAIGLSPPPGVAMPAQLSRGVERGVDPRLAPMYGRACSLSSAGGAGVADGRAPCTGLSGVTPWSLGMAGACADGYEATGCGSACWAGSKVCRAPTQRCLSAPDEAARISVVPAMNTTPRASVRHQTYTAQHIIHNMRLAVRAGQLNAESTRDDSNYQRHAASRIPYTMHGTKKTQKADQEQVDMLRAGLGTCSAKLASTAVVGPYHRTSQG